MAATTPRKRTTTRKKVAGTPGAGVLVLDRQENVDAIQAIIDDREPLFTLGGVTYTVPKKAPAAWTIKALDLARTVSDSVAVDYAMSKMLGVDGYKALAECETLTQSDFNVLRDEVLKRVIPEGPKVS